MSGCSDKLQIVGSVIMIKWTFHFGFLGQAFSGVNDGFNGFSPYGHNLIYHQP